MKAAASKYSVNVQSLRKAVYRAEKTAALRLNNRDHLSREAKKRKRKATTNEPRQEKAKNTKVRKPFRLNSRQVDKVQADIDEKDLKFTVAFKAATKMLLDAREARKVDNTLKLISAKDELKTRGNILLNYP